MDWADVIDFIFAHVIMMKAAANAVGYICVGTVFFDIPALI